MANYEFKCNDCGKRFTVQQTFAEHDREPRPSCPKCSSENIEQIISTVHVQTSKKS